jgi:hypothetical protein
MLAATKVPIITTVRIAILATSFAFIFTFIVVLLLGPGEFLLGSTVASDFVKSKRRAKS